MHERFSHFTFIEEVFLSVVNWKKKKGIQR